MVWSSGQISPTRHRYILHASQYDPKLDRFCRLNVARELDWFVCKYLYPSLFPTLPTLSFSLSLSLSLSSVYEQKLYYPGVSQRHHADESALISSERLGILGEAHFRNSWTLWCRVKVGKERVRRRDSPVEIGFCSSTWCVGYFNGWFIRSLVESLFYRGC